MIACRDRADELRRIRDSIDAFAKGGREDFGIDAIEWAVRAAELGAGEILLNSIDADGTGDGYDLELCKRVIDAVPVPVIASGGAGTLDQITAALLSEEQAAGGPSPPPSLPCFTSERPRSKK